MTLTAIKMNMFRSLRGARTVTLKSYRGSSLYPGCAVP